jgi:hypothetical protein
VHADHLAAQAADLDRAKRDLLDDALEVPRLDDHRVADPEPALEEHEQPGEDVREEALRREGEHDRQEGRADDGLHPARSGQRHEREHERDPEREVGDARLDERDRGLALLQAADDARVHVVGSEPVAALAAVDEKCRRSSGQACQQPGDEEETGDDDQAPEGRVDRRRVGEELGETVHRGRSGRG